MEILSKIRQHGFKTVFKNYYLFSKNIINNKIKYSKIHDYELLRKYFENKKGLEIGGSSNIFYKNNFIPVYNIMGYLDGVNFSRSNVWTKKDENNENFVINDKIVGNLLITDAVDLSIVHENEYDFILSSNNIEHIANPLKAVEKMLSKLMVGGVIVIVVPKKESNIDHKRDVVMFEHLLDDYNKNVGEDDSSHFEEVLLLHDVTRDVLYDHESFKEIVHDNVNNRRLHHHVFDLEVLEQILLFFNMEVIKKDFRETDYIIIAEKK
ncbi:methyltransferase domain-containing protein [Methanobrevibacter curvatus]|uniref:Methyltransferase domain protein n=1 Tax=Methanobrevibacter curvatus TaxID=49547 RepID=A0A166A0E6_9EURY|nr:methyltransferase domain-containing protein [Methanobrevibacter curvatus]KZX11406.1 hypothetical protein MBCUR_14400 [Methanobrevibacter curvatus]